MKERTYKRLNESSTLEELKSISSPNKGDVSYVKEDGYDYRFNGKKWKRITLQSKPVVGWVIAGVSVLTAVAIALPVSVAVLPKFLGNNSQESESTTTKEAMIGFVTNGGSAVDPIVKNPGETVTAPASPTKPGYNFVGWFTDSDLNNAYTFSTMPSDNLTLYAKWSIVYYTVHFEANLDGYPYEVPTQDPVPYGTIIDNPGVLQDWVLSEVPLDAYEFSYWGDSNEDYWDFSKPVTEDITIYACWAHAK